MEDLKSLIDVITKNKIKRIEILGKPSNHSSNVEKLYEGIVKGEFIDEGEAKSHFYGETDHKDIYFSRLKRTLFKRLVNTLFFIDVNRPEFNEIQRAYYTCYRDFAAIKMLLGRGVRAVAISLSNKLLQNAIKFEFTDLVVEVSRQLRIHYGSIEGDRKLFLKYNKLYKEYFEISRCESLAEEYYVDLASYFANSIATNSEIISIAEEYSNSLSKLEPPKATWRFEFLSFYVHTLRYEIQNDYPNMLRVCEEAVTLFESKKNQASKTISFTFLLKIIACHTQLKNYVEGEKTVMKCLDLGLSEKINWFSLHHYYMILLFHSRQYEKAVVIFQKVIVHPNFKALPANLIEQWLIHEAFLNFFIALNKITFSTNDSPLRKFRLGKFLNEVPTYAKDKRGNNITIIILQILFFLQRKKMDLVIDRMESLKMYCHRYLRKDDTFRSNCFIKMLMVLPEAHFNKTAAIRKVKKYHDRLLEVPLETANQSNELEIIPYEILWEYILELLGPKFYKV